MTRCQRPSICLSQAGAVSQRLDVLSCNARDNLGIFRTALQLRLKDFKYHRASRGPRAPCYYQLANICHGQSVFTSFTSSFTSCSCTRPFPSSVITSEFNTARIFVQPLGLVRRQSIKSPPFVFAASPNQT